MTITSVVSTLDGIAMAADSRLLRNINIANNKYFVPASDQTEKLLIIREGTVGITFFGEGAIINGETVADIIREIDKTKISHRDHVKTVVKKIQKHFYSRCSNLEITFFVAGYHDNEQFIFYVNETNIQRLNKSSQNDEILHALWFGGDTELVHDILERFKFDPTYTPLGDAIEIAEFVISFVSKYHKYFHLRETCGGPIDVLYINRDGAKFVKNKLGVS